MSLLICGRFYCQTAEILGFRIVILMASQFLSSKTSWVMTKKCYIAWCKLLGIAIRGSSLSDQSVFASFVSTVMKGVTKNTVFGYS